MNTGNPSTVCKSCGNPGNGKYCPRCGQAMAVKRLSLHEMVHEVLHFFTHVEKGFLYTLKMLVTAPGKMQKEYVDGVRVRHQKPFSMFFISATASALIYYAINTVIVKQLHAGSADEADFFRRYWALFHTLMMPLYSFITYLFFKRSGHYFGEIAVLQLYLFSFLFLVISVLQLVRLFVPAFETRYVELPLIVVYSVVTNLNFFSRLKKAEVIGISVLCITVVFGMATFLQDKAMELIYRH